MATHRCPRVAIVALAALSATSCADSPSDGAGSSESETGDDGRPLPGENYFPLVDGASWTYLHLQADGGTSTEVTSLRPVDYAGEPAFELIDEPNAAGEQSISTILRRGDEVLRVRKDDLVGDTLSARTIYDPGFLRFDYGWVEGAQVPSMFERIEQDAQGAVVDQGVRYDLYTIESVSTPVEVPAGTFDCVQFLRERTDNGESERFWFAPGIGKVKQESPMTGASEQLIGYGIP